jgi:SSS family solute:Na+ symporter
MAQNFWTAIFAWTSCFVATILISLATTREKSDDDLKGLVWALTPRITDRSLPLWKRPATLGIVVLGCTLILNLIFW